MLTERKKKVLDKLVSILPVIDEDQEKRLMISLDTLGMYATQKNEKEQQQDKGDTRTAIT